MSNTRIILDRQSDLILSGATLSTPHISSPTGLVQGDISGLTSSLASLTSKDASIDARISGELSRLNAVDLSIGERTTLEESNRTTADESLTTKVSTEEVARTSADESLTTKVSTEEVARTSADNSLNVRISNEESTKTSADDSLNLRTSLETSVRISADNSIEAKISTAQADIDHMLDGSNSALDQFYEVVNYIESVDLVNDNNIVGMEISQNLRLTAEASTRLAADNSLATRISGETSARISGDESLSSKVSLEVSRRESADISLVAKLSNDITTSNSTNDNLISIEEDLRASTDLSLEDLINSQGLQETLDINSVGVISSEFNVVIGDNVNPTNTLTLNNDGGWYSRLQSNLGSGINQETIAGKNPGEFASTIVLADGTDGGISVTSGAMSVFNTNVSYGSNGISTQYYSNSLLSSTNHIINVDDSLITLRAIFTDNNLDQFIHIDPTGMMITDERPYDLDKGLEYASDYTANFVTHSLITKDYADTVDLSLEERILIEESIVDYNDKYGQVESVRVTISQQTSVRSSADISIRSNISTFTSANTSRENSLNQRVTVAEGKREQDVASLATRIGSAGQARLSADFSLHNSVVAQQSRIDAMLLNSTDGLDQFYEVVNYVNSLDLVNDNQALSSQISLNAKITAEESTNLSSDLSLTSRISAEESLRASQDGSLTTRVSDEESLRASADLSLVSKLSTDLETANSSINTRISTEESVRASADSSLNTRLSIEESANLSADTSIQTRITNFDPGTVEFVTVSGSVNGSNKTFVASKNLSTATIVFVTLNGLVQFPTNDYTFDNIDTITFNTAPDGGSRVDAFYFDLSSL